MKKFHVFFVITLLFSIYSFSQEKSVQISGEPSYTYLHRNYISTGFFNNGISDIDRSASNSGLSYPKLTDKTAMYTSGFLWGTKIAGDPFPRVGGSAYRSGLRPGKILNSGLPWNQLTFEDPTSSNVRIYRVRRDVFPNGPAVDLTEESIIESKSQAEIRQQYELDWMEWPASSGAPYEDINLNGVYNPNFDIPGFIGADQTIWFVANDLNQSLTWNLYGSDPIGMELQVTIWSYLQHETLNHVFFKKYKLINKSNTVFDSTYVTMWGDPDIGESINDFAGCDPTLNLGYAYNGTNYDNIYEFTPPAIGFTLLKGPSINAATNLGMTAFYYFSIGDPNVSDPTQGSPDGSVQFYNFMQGKVGLTGQLFIDPTTGQPTTFALNGNPITQSGWIDGMLLPGGDRRIGICSGPFNMAPGDTQEVIVSEAVGIGDDRIESIKVLKFHSILSKELFENNFNFTRSPVIPTPSLTIEQVNSHFKLRWDTDSSVVNEIENYSKDGFNFQGYNVYQLSSPLLFRNNGHRAATYDIQDGITQISGTVMNNLGHPTNGILYPGNDTGINRDYLATSDIVDGIYFIPGKKYYFAVTAYGYNSSPATNPNTIESMLDIIEVTFVDSTAWINYGQVLEVTQIAGIGNADIRPTVVDPYLLTNHIYKIFFTEDTGGSLLWNLKDITLGIDILLNQDDFSGSLSSPIADGIQLKIMGITFLSTMSSVKLNDLHLPNFGTPGYPGTNWMNDNWNITDYTYFSGYNTGTSFEVVGYGSQLVDDLEQDYEIRWTGVVGDTVINGQTVAITKSGGSMATIYGARLYSIANHPLNPNPGSTNRFLVRVPFEIWNKDENIQINYEIYDRSQSDPAANGFRVWNTDSRMYCQVLNTPYNPNAIADPIIDGPNYTWNHVWYESNFTLGDVIAIDYDAPLQAGVDEFTFHNTISAVENVGVPEEYKLFQNYPNPFNPATKIKYSVAAAGIVSLKIFDVLGREVSTLVNEEKPAGQFEVNFNASHLASGVYFYQLKVYTPGRAGSPSSGLSAGRQGSGWNFIQTKKMLLLK